MRVKKPEPEVELDRGGQCLERPHLLGVLVLLM